MTFLNRHRSRIRPVGPFAPSSLFFGGIPGAWYDPTDLSTMFQDNTGLTPVTAVEQPVGLIFDKSQGTPAARYNLLTFSEQFNDASWTKQNTTTSANTTVAPDGTTTADTLVETAALGIHVTYQTITGCTIGTRYTFTCYAKAAQRSYVALQIYNNVSNARFATLFDIVGGTVVTTRMTNAPTGTSSSITDAGNGWWRLQITMDQVGGTTNIPQIGLSDSASPVFAADMPQYLGDGTSGAFIWGAQLQTGSTATTYQRITTGTGGEWTPGNHASQSTAASRPTYRARYNLLTFSEDYGNAAWSKIGATVATDTTTAPDGTTTADTITATGAFGGAQQSLTRSSAIVVYTASAYLKASTKSVGRLTMSSNATANGVFADFTLTGAGAATAVSTYGAGWVAGVASITSVGNGWYRCTVSGTSPASTDLAMVTGHPGTAVAGDAIFAWGAQLLTAADVTATGNAYQRIAAATVYDTAAVFRPYLAFDGMDDSLSTAAINFTSTDKMSVFSGLSKLADPAGAIQLELSSDSFSNNGAFMLLAPRLLNDKTYTASLRGTIYVETTTPASYTPPVTSVKSDLLDISGATKANIRINGASVVTNAASVGTGNFGNYPLFVGRRNNTSFPFNGRLYELIVRGAASSVTEIADTELWVNARTGAF